MSGNRVQYLRFGSGFSNAFSIKCVGLSCALVLFQKNDSVVSSKSFSNSHIDVMVQNEFLRTEVQ